MVIFLSASESHNQSNLNRTIEESLNGFKTVMEVGNAADIPVRGAIAVAFGCPFEGNVQPEQVKRVVDRLLELGAYGITLGNTTDMATPLSSVFFVKLF